MLKCVDCLLCLVLLVPDVEMQIENQPKSGELQAVYLYACQRLAREKACVRKCNFVAASE